MGKYLILAESGGDVPKEMAEKYGIYIIPMHVSFGNETKDDGFFPTTDIFDYYKNTGKLPKTAACNSYEFEEMYDKIHAEHPDSHILYLAYSAVTTSTYQSGLVAMEGRDYITPFDTKFCSAGQAYVILLMARYIEEHPDASIEEIIAYGEDIRPRTHMGFFPGDLDYLRAGGRVSNAAYMGAKILSLNPLIEINDGYLVASKKYRGKMNKVSKKLLREYVEEHHFTKDLLFLIHSPRFPESQMEELTQIAKELGFQEIRWICTGSVVSTHSGPGAFGVVGLSEK